MTFDAPAAPEDGAPQGAAPPQGALARSNSDDFQENDGVAAEDDDSDDDDSDEDFGGLATDKEDRYGCLQVLTETHLIAGACPPQHPWGMQGGDANGGQGDHVSAVQEAAAGAARAGARDGAVETCRAPR